MTDYNTAYAQTSGVGDATNYNYYDATAAADGQQEAMDMRPDGLSEKQDQIIQNVAEYVVNSCHPTEYQLRLRRKTKFNSNFGFLDPHHPFNNYYQYLLQSYRHWKEYAAGAGGAMYGSGAVQDENYDYYQQQVEQQQLESNYMYASSGAGPGGSYMMGYDQQQGQYQQTMPGGWGSGVGEYRDANNAVYDDPTAAVGASGYYQGPGDAVLPPPTSYYPQQQQQQQYQEDDEDEDDGAYEYVEVNGVKTLVPRSN